MHWCEISFVRYRIHNVLSNTAYRSLDTAVFFYDPSSITVILLKNNLRNRYRLFGIAWSTSAWSSPCHVFVCPCVSIKSCRTLIATCTIYWKMLPCANTRTLPSSVDSKYVGNDEDSTCCLDIVRVLDMMKSGCSPGLVVSGGPLERGRTTWPLDQQTVESLHRRLLS